MKKLFSTRSAQASFSAANERAASASDKRGRAKASPARRLIESIRDNRFVISCIMVAVLGAAALGILVSGSAPASTDALSQRSALAPAGGQTGAPLLTPPPSASKTAEPIPEQSEAYASFEPQIVLMRDLPVIHTVEPVPGENEPRPSLPPLPAPERYEIPVTEVPQITPGIHSSDSRIIANYGEHNSFIPAVQERLMILWYMDQDEPTDYLGRVTTGAIEAFQRRNDLPVDGRLTSRTYNTLFSNDAKSYLCSFGDTGSDVEYIQDRLYELGYLKERSGEFDDATLDAVKEFQQLNDLAVDGKVGRNTKEALYSPDAKAMQLEYGDYGERVLFYQLRLKELGYLTTEPDGMYGTDTRMAVTRFQAQNGLVVDGHLGPSTCAMLESEEVSGNVLSYAMHGSDVANVQARLYELNYLRAQDVSGYYTSITEQAVKLFQRNNGLDADGKVGRFTMNKLMSQSAVRASSPVVPQSGGSGSSGNSGNSGSSGNSGNSGNSGSTISARINNFLSIARSKMGSRYVRGGKGPSVFDCSGFVYWCMNRAGINQSYMTSYMWRSCTRYPRNNSIYNVKKGDVIVYYGHVAICSDTWTQIDASQSNGKVVERTFNSPYWHRNFICSFHIFN